MVNKQNISYILILFLGVAIIFSGCGQAYHLRQSKRHELIAISKGATVATDTVYVKVPVFVKETALDSIFVTLPGDTVVLTKDRLHVKFVDLPGDSIFIQGRCDSMVIVKEVPVTVTKVVSAEKSWMSNWLLFLLGGFAVGVVLTFFIRK